MIKYKRGDIVLVNFVFSDKTGIKRRPALIVSSDAYHQGRQEVIIAAVTSRSDRILVGDHLITKWREAGLLFSFSGNWHYAEVDVSVNKRQLCGFCAVQRQGELAISMQKPAGDVLCVRACNQSSI